MNDNDLFEVLGYLANPQRECKLDAEMPKKKRIEFESQYSNLSGLQPHPNDQNYYILHDNADKWGVELRIYFNGDKNNALSSIRTTIVSSCPRIPRDHRINNNNLVWKLIEYGFLLQDTQDEVRIRGKVPSQYMTDFDRGFSLI